MSAWTPSDNRRRLVELTMDGRLPAGSSTVKAARIAELSLAVDGAAGKTLLALLSRLALNSTKDRLNLSGLGLPTTAPR